jgi:hypothetical protein
VSRDENAVGDACDALAVQLGYRVENYSDTRRVRTCPGLPDRRYVKRGVRLWVELKAPGGKMTDDQLRFLLSELDANGMATVIDDDVTLRKLFQQLGRSSSIVEAQVRVQCRELVELCAKRGLRKAA